jgi:hypothetical protein
MRCAPALVAFSLSLISLGALAQNSSVAYNEVVTNQLTAPSSITLSAVCTVGGTSYT